MTIDELKQRVNLPELARWLGVKKAKGPEKSTLWHAPGRPDKEPSLSIFEGKSHEWLFKDHATNQRGTCVDFVIYIEGGDVKSAIKRLHEFLGVPMEAPAREEPREVSLAEHIAARCRDNPEGAIAYLVDERKIPEALVKRAIADGTVGWNTWTSSKVPPNERGHGGPAAAFIVRSRNPGHVVAVDLRFINPVLNGGQKTASHGDKTGHPWCSSWRRFEDAHTVYVCEGAVDALSIESLEMPYTAAIAIRGTATVEEMNWRILQGKQVVLCLSNDKPFPADHQLAGIQPGLRAAWRAHELLTELDISALLVDQLGWEWKDVNEMLQKVRDPAEVRGLVQKLEPWVIPGRPPRDEIKLPDGAMRPKARVYLPWQDENRYWGYRVRPDFTSTYREAETEDPESGDKVMKPVYKDLAGFRIAALSRVTIASSTSTMTGDPDAQPTVMFSVSVQTPRHGAKLARRVVEDEKLHNIDNWKKFGPVFSQSDFLRLVNVLERTAHLGARQAVNFVGMAWREGRLVVNEGPGCYFLDPKQQCPYWRLTFPSGSPADARRVITAYQRTFGDNAGSLVLVWALGAHLKALLGFWPHMEMQASKGSGKSTFTKHLERTIAMTMFSGESIQTPFRILTSLSYTSHPVGWEEISARKQDVIDYAVRMLQEAYQYTVTQRTAEMKEFLVSAPVLLAGEDVPAKSLAGKLIRTSLKTKGEILKLELPRFPVRQWLEFLTTLSRKPLLDRYDKLKEDMAGVCMASTKDGSVVRMIGNYAAVRLAWELLTEFAGMDVNAGNFPRDLASAMNGHVRESSADRHPWVWITEKLLSELAKGNFQYPHKWDMVDVDRQPGEDDDGKPPEKELCLVVRTSHVMEHLASTSSLRDFYNQLPVKSDRVYKQQLKDAGVIAADAVERTVGAYEKGGGRRVSNMAALSIPRLERYGLHAVVPAEPPSASNDPGGYAAMAEGRRST